MIRLFLISLVWAGCAAAYARDSYVPGSEAVLHELSRRSSISESELKDALSDCDKDQMHIFFCSYRDAVVADLKLRHAAGERIRRMPQCKSAIDAQLKEWHKSLIPACEKASKKDYDGGSMRSTAAAMCQAASAEEFSKKMAASSKTCRVRER